MDAELITYFKQQGPWAVLFVSTLIYVLKQNQRREEASQKREDDSKSREDKLIGIVEEQTANFTRLTINYEQLTGEVRDIKQSLKH